MDIIVILATLALIAILKLTYTYTVWAFDDAMQCNITKRTKFLLLKKLLF